MLHKQLLPPSVSIRLPGGVVVARLRSDNGMDGSGQRWSKTIVMCVNCCCNEPNDFFPIVAEPPRLVMINPWLGRAGGEKKTHAQPTRLESWQDKSESSQ